MSNKNDKIRTPALATAVAVLKGAVTKVLATPTTHSFTYTSKSKGRLAVVFNGQEDIPPAQLQEIIKLANGAIVDNLPIKVQKMARKEAEEKFGDKIFDLIPPPAELTELNVLVIEGWTVNAVKDGEYLASTGLLSAIFVSKTTLRTTKQHVEFLFDLVEDEKKIQELRSAAKPSNSAKGSAPSSAPAKKVVARQEPTVGQISSELVDFFLAQLQQVDASTDEGKKKLRESLLAESTLVLNGLQNASFAAGFKARQNDPKK